MKLTFNFNQRNFVNIEKNLRVKTSLNVSFAYIFFINDASSFNNLDDDFNDDAALSEDFQQGIFIFKLYIMLII